jgi:hypothetical protein
MTWGSVWVAGPSPYEFIHSLHCAGSTPARKESSMPQAIRINGTGQVVANDRVVAVRRNEDVLWIATQNGGPWKITFDKSPSGGQGTYPIVPGSPFSQADYAIAQGGSGGSTGGPVNGTVRRTYRYNVRNASDVITDDPDIDIDP